jgi:hypothetical protein
VTTPCQQLCPYYGVSGRSNMDLEGDEYRHHGRMQQLVDHRSATAATLLHAVRPSAVITVAVRGLPVRLFPYCCRCRWRPLLLPLPDNDDGYVSLAIGPRYQLQLLRLTSCCARFAPSCCCDRTSRRGCSARPPPPAGASLLRLPCSWPPFFFEKSLSLPLESLAWLPRCHRVPHRRGRPTCWRSP